jgi:hypothetical protein
LAIVISQELGNVAGLAESIARERLLMTDIKF